MPNLTSVQPLIPIPNRAVAVAEKLLAAHAFTPPGVFPQKTELDVANAALKQKWVDLELAAQIEKFFSTDYPHTKEEAEAFLRYAQRTVESLQIVLLKDRVDQMLIEDLRWPDKSRVKI